MDPKLKSMLKPMLCKSTTDGQPPSMVNGGAGWVVEEKYDGWRALAHLDAAGQVHLYGGRNGADYSGQVPYIESEIAKLLPPDTIVDGEIVGPEWGCVQGAMTRTVPSTPSDQLKLMVFDIIRLCTRDIRGVPWTSRRDALDNDNVFDFDACQHVELTTIHAPTSNMHNLLVQKGAEGSVWKREQSTYQSGQRSNNWLKWKFETTDEFECSGFIPGKGEFAGMIGAIEFKLPNGKTSTASGMDLTTRKEMTDHPEKWIGKPVEIKHNGIMRSGSPRHPQYLRRRDDKAPARPRADAFVRPVAPPRAAGPTKGWMRNYAAMGDEKLLRCIEELRMGAGDAADRVEQHGASLDVHAAKAEEVAQDRGLTLR